MSKLRNRDGMTKTATAVAALGVVTAVGGVAATQPTSISTSLVDLTALIVVGSSTRPDPVDVEDFFGGKFNQAPYNPGGLPGPDLIGLNFYDGTDAINDALQANSGEHNAVMSSGWGAANISWVLSQLDRDADPVLPNSVFVLDNNVARPDGGFGTRYPFFALIGVNPFPSPTDTAAQAVIDTAIQYNYNSNAPADLFNLVAHVNSLVAYVYQWGGAAEFDLPVDVDGNPTVSCGGANTCAVLASGADPLACDDARCDTPEGDRVVAYVTKRGNTTYVTYTVDELPLARLIRDVFGDTAADVSEPILKLIVDSAYYDGNPIPSDPSQYRPARLMPSLGEMLSTASKVPAAIDEGLQALSDNASGDAEDEARSVDTKQSTVRPETGGGEESEESEEFEEPDTRDTEPTGAETETETETETEAAEPDETLAEADTEEAADADESDDTERRAKARTGRDEDGADAG